jgi:1-phosphofructokinase
LLKNGAFGGERIEEGGMKIVTFTLNPAVDFTIRLGRLTPGEVHRAESASIRAGGKGVNVSANLAGYGLDNTASGFLADGNAELFERYFAKLHIPADFVRVKGENRTNIKMVDAAGTTDVNLAGFAVSEQDVERLAAGVESLFIEEKGIAVLAGSLPRSCPPDIYRTLVENLKTLGCAVFLDASGPALENVLSAAVMPDCIKPNMREFSEWAGRPLETHKDIIEAAQSLLAKGVKLAAVSLGEGGALFMSRERAYHAFGQPKAIAATVGAGDAMTAGMVCAWAADPQAAVTRLEHTARMATAFAVNWLERRARLEPVEDEGHFRKDIEALMDRVTVKRI